MRSSSSAGSRTSSKQLFRALPLFISALVSLLLVVPFSLQAQNTVGTIEFFGSGGINVNALRMKLPIKPGEILPPSWKQEVQETVTRQTGKPPTDVVAICCDEKNNRTVFIGLEGTTFQAQSYRPSPRGSNRLPDAVIALGPQLEAALRAAVSNGQSGENDQAGYALADNPAARAVQLQMRQFALSHTDELTMTLSQAKNNQARETASTILGYAAPSDKQVQSLTKAINDPDEAVRDNATRALAVLLHARPDYTKSVDRDRVIQMLHSGTWTDRNKSAFLLEAMTSSRNPEILSRLHRRAWDALIEMAVWKDAGHAVSSRIILGRISGVPDDRLEKIVWSGSIEEITRGDIPDAY